MFSHPKRFLSLLALLVLLFVLALPAAAQMTPSVTVSDQAILKGTVTIEKVVSDGPGWIVIHTQKDGKPGPIIGHAAVSDGENDNVVVQIDATAATATLYAMLHTDAGQVGTYEFPGDDVPVKVGDVIITPPFKVVGAAPAALPETGAAPSGVSVSLLLLLAGALALGGGFGLMLARKGR